MTRLGYLEAARDALEVAIVNLAAAGTTEGPDLDEHFYRIDGELCRLEVTIAVAKSQRRAKMIRIR